MKERALLVAARQKLDDEISEIDLFLGRPVDSQIDPAPLDTSVESDGSISRQIIEFAAANILPGTSLTTEKIYHLMVVNGIKFPQEGRPPQVRITRVISGTGLYKGHKSKGWSLKENDPVASGS